MSKKRKPKEAPVPEHPVVTSVRVAEVVTKQGTFYRLVYLETQNGQVRRAVPAHDYFSSVSDLVDRADEIMDAVNQPVVQIDSVNPRN